MCTTEERKAKAEFSPSDGMLLDLEEKHLNVLVSAEVGALGQDQSVWIRKPTNPLESPLVPVSGRKQRHHAICSARVYHVVSSTDVEILQEHFVQSTFWVHGFSTTQATRDSEHCQHRNNENKSFKRKL
jgi:hypothetical protein